MEKTEDSSHIYKPMMAGLFAGYFATIINLVFDLGFRQYTGFPLHELINVSTLIFATLLALPLAGCVFALIDRFFRNSAIIYIILSLIVTFLLIYGTWHIHRSSDVHLSIEFRNLLLGIVLITSVFSTFGIPYFVKHNELYM